MLLLLLILLLVFLMLNISIVIIIIVIVIVIVIVIIFFSFIFYLSRRCFFTTKHTSLHEGLVFSSSFTHILLFIIPIPTSVLQLVNMMI